MGEPIWRAVKKESGMQDHAAEYIRFDGGGLTYFAGALKIDDWT